MSDDRQVALVDKRACPACEGTRDEAECGWLAERGDGTCEAYDA